MCIRDSHQRGLEVLLLEAAVHHAGIDPVHVPGADARMRQGGARYPRHQAFGIGIVEFAERDM